MAKRLLIISLIMACCPVLAASAGAGPSYWAEQPAQGREAGADISYSDGFLLVNGAEGEVLEVTALTGKKVFTARIDSPAQKIELNVAKGCYIVKVGKLVRKISVR